MSPTRWGRNVLPAGAARLDWAMRSHSFHLIVALLLASAEAADGRRSKAGGKLAEQQQLQQQQGKAPQQPKHAGNATVALRAPSCAGKCPRRESVATQHMHLEQYAAMVDQVGPVKAALALLLLLVLLVMAMRTLLSAELLVTLFYIVLYFIASPFAIMVNKILMKDYGFGYPVMVSALGQTTTAVCSSAVVRCFGLSIENGRRVGCRSLLLLGGASAFALVLGQYPYLYLTVAFIQMLKAFSPTRRSG